VSTDQSKVASCQSSGPVCHAATVACNATRLPRSWPCLTHTLLDCCSCAVRLQLCSAVQMCSAVQRCGTAHRCRRGLRAR
jgi:hypothetical protein